MLDVQDELLHALPATLVDDWLKGSCLILNQGTLFILNDFRSVSFDGLDVRLYGLHELDWLDIVNGVHGDAVLGNVANVRWLKSAVALGGRLKSTAAPTGQSPPDKDKALKP